MQGCCWWYEHILYRWMDMSSRMVKTIFHDINSCIHNSYVETSHKSMINAACEVQRDSNNNNLKLQVVSLYVNTKVSGDGRCQKQGYSSLNGVMTLTANGKCNDNEVISKKV